LKCKQTKKKLDLKIPPVVSSADVVYKKKKKKNKMNMVIRKQQEFICNSVSGRNFLDHQRRRCLIIDLFTRRETN